MTDLEQQHAAYRQKPGVCDGCRDGLPIIPDGEPYGGWHITDMPHTYRNPCTALPILEWADQRDKAYRYVCSEAYQLAGAIGAPSAVLDNLSAASAGYPIPHETFLPITPEDCSTIASQAREIGELREGLTKMAEYVIGNAIDTYRELSASLGTEHPGLQPIREKLREIAALLSRTGEPQEKPSSEDLTTNADPGASERKS